MRTDEIKRRIAELLAQAEHARTLGSLMTDNQTQRNIAEYASGLEREAAELEKQAPPKAPSSGSDHDDPA